MTSKNRAGLVAVSSLEEEKPERYKKRNEDRDRIPQNISREARGFRTRPLGDRLDHEVGAVPDIRHRPEKNGGA